VSYEDLFNARGNDPVGWFFYGHFLHTSAQTLGATLKVDDFRQGVYGMLLGYTVEAYLKAKWLIGGGRLAEGGRFVRVPNCGDHELLQLADAVGFKLSTAERHVVNRLSAFVKFAGRYPIPTTAAAMTPVAHPRGGMIMPGFFLEEDWELAEAVVARLRQELRNWADNPSSPRDSA
jgi:hypothetical protein